MTKDVKTLILNAIINLINTVVKFSAGIIFNFSPSIADSIYSFSDFITDLMDLMGSKISNKKPTKYHPFGFGRIEYITNLFVGVLLLIIGCGIFIHSFHLYGIKTNLLILIFMFVSIFLKSLSIIKLKQTFKKTKNKSIYLNIAEAKLDIFSSMIVCSIVILTHFSKELTLLNYIPIIGSIIISCLIIKSSIELLKDNVLILLGAVDNNEDYINFIKEELKMLNVEADKIELIRYGSYYKVHLVLFLREDMTILEAKQIQTSVIKELRKMRKIKIKFVNIDLDISSN